MSYTTAVAAASTAALAASNAASSAAAASTHYANALRALVVSLDEGELDEEALTTFLAFCMDGAEEAAAEAVEARENAAAAFALAAEASETQPDKAEFEDEGEAETGTETETESELNIFGADRESVMNEWAALRQNLSEYHTPGADEPVPTWAVVETLWDADAVLSHAEANEEQYQGTSHSEQKALPRKDKVGEWSGGLLTKRDRNRTMQTAYGWVTEILRFNLYVAVEPVDRESWMSFSPVSETMLRDAAGYEAGKPEKGDLALGFYAGEGPGEELLFGFGRVVDVVPGDEVYLVRNGNEEVGVDVWN